MNSMGFVEFWKIIPVFAQGKELQLNSRDLLWVKSSGLGYCIKGVAGKKKLEENKFF